MTVFRIDGFETYGDTGTSNADIETRIADSFQTTFQSLNGGFSGSKSLIAATNGFAMQFPQLGSAQGEFLVYEFPNGSFRHTNLKVSTNASIKENVCGFRFYCPDITDNLTVELFAAMTSASSSASSVSLLSGTGVRVRDASSGDHDATGVFTKGAWHYVEVEYKLAPASAGGYMKVYVDGTEVVDTGSVNITTFTFFSQYGLRLGVKASANQTDTSEFFALDDMYVLYYDGVIDSAPLGNCQVIPLKPDADASPNDWTPSSGTDNFAMIDGDDWDTGTYVEGSSGNDDHYTAVDLGSVDAVHAVQFTTIVQGQTSASDLQIGCDNGTADEQNMGSIGTGSVVSKHQCHEVDPSGSAWTQSSVNSVESTQRVV